MADYGPPIWSASMSNPQQGTPPLLTRSSRATIGTDTSALSPQAESVFSVNSQQNLVPAKPTHSYLPRASAIGSNGNSNDGTGDDGVAIYTKKSQARHWVDAGYTLQIVVKRAINVGTEVAAPDPYVRLFLGSADTSECAVRAGTRVTYRNRNPNFEETFTFSLKGQPYDDAYLTCNVLHDEPFFKDACLGQFQSRLSMLLGSLASVGVPLTDKYPLTNRNGDLIAGEVEMQFVVLPPTAKLQDLVPGNEVYSQANLNQRCSSRSLELDVRAIHGLKTVVDDDTINRVINDLKVEIRVGTVSVREDVKAEMVPVPATATRFSSTSLKLDKKIIVPLNSAFAISSYMLNQFRTQMAMELGDVRIYLMNGNVSICKAQFPLWALDEQKPPAQGKSGGGDAGAADGTATVAVDAVAGKAVDAPAADTTQAMRLPMERYGKALVLPVELECAMQLISSSKVAPGAEAPVVHSLAAEDEEDVASAPPLDPALIPAPLPTMVLDEHVEAGPCRLYAALVSSDSAIMKRIWESEGLTEVVVPEWSGEAGCTRTITYVRKLNIPMGPKSCNVKESQKLVAKQPGGWVLEIEISTTAPKGDLFVVKQQVIVQKTSAPTTSNMRVSMMVDWIKPGGMLKGIIERSATGDSKAHWTTVLSSIRSLGAVTATAAASVVEDGEDVVSAPPLDPAVIPAPLPTVVLDEQFAVGPNRLYSTILSSQSPVMKRIWETEGMSDMVVPEFSNSVRTITCVRKLNIPMGPKSCNVHEKQKLVAKQPGGWVLEVEISTTAPKGDLFVVKWQVVVRKTSSATTSHVRVSMMVDWIKSGGMLKGIIERSATADSKAHWALVAENIRTLAPVAGKAVSVTLTPVAITAGTAAAPAQAGSMGLPAWLQRVVETVLGPFPVPVLLCMLGMLALIVLIFWRQVSALQASQGQALERSTVALERVALALERMSSMPASGLERGGVPTSATVLQTEL